MAPLESFLSLWWIWIPLIVIAVIAIGLSISWRKTLGYNTLEIGVLILQVVTMRHPGRKE